MTLKESIERICDILESPEYPQIHGDLIQFDADNKCIGKCALGEIACRVGLPLSYNKRVYIYDEITKAAGIPKEFRNGFNLPYMNRIKDKVYYDDEDMSSGSNIEEYIYNTNDAGFTYTEIADFLRCTFLND